MADNSAAESYRNENLKFKSVWDESSFFDIKCFAVEFGCLRKTVETNVFRLFGKPLFGTDCIFY